MTRKIKVLHIITRLIIGGAQENTAYTVFGLRNIKGYETDLASGPTYGPEGSIEEELKSHGVEIICIPALRRDINPVYDFLAFCQIVSIIKKGGYDIVHTHSSKAGFLGRMAAKLCGVKNIIHTIHGLPFHPYQSKFRNFVYLACERISAPLANKILCVSEAMVKQALKAGVGKQDKFKVIYSGLDIQDFHPIKADVTLKRQFGIKENEIVIGKVARLFHLKGHEYLLKAISRLTDEFPHIKILLVGDGILRGKIERQANDLGIRDKVVFAGLVSRDKIPQMLSLMDFVVHCSLREGLARVIPQAMAMEKPVIAFDVDGAREIIENNVNGFLVEPEDTEGLKAAIKKLLANPSLIKGLGTHGRKKILPHFDKDYMTAEIEKIYKKFL